MPSSYYLYLTEESWVVPWERGGKVPINPASAYRSEVRDGTRTPDEVVQQTLKGVPDWVVGSGDGPSPIKLEAGAGKLVLENVGLDWGGKQAHVVLGEATSRLEDGLILSLATKLDASIAKRLGKAACVKIRCMACLIEALDTQIGTRSKWGKVRYRDGFERNHFLKSTADAWQNEYRLLWRTPDSSPRMVELPPNIASRVYW